MEQDPKKKVLLVEDEVIQAMTGKMSLEKYGYSVVTVNSGEKAVAFTVGNPDIDLILMDIDLGSGIDGTEAAAQILQIRDIPVVFLSSHTESDIVEKTERITSYGYVVKNSSITVLDASIKMAFKLFAAKVGEQKKEEMLRLSEEKYRLIFEHSPLGLLSFDEFGHLVACNANFAQIIGTSCERLLGLDMLALPDGRLVENVRKALNGSIGSYEGLYRSATANKETYVKGHFTPMLDSSGKNIGGVGIVEDISLYTKTETELFRSQSRYRTLFDHSPISIWEEDFSELKIRLDHLRPVEGKNWRGYFDRNPGEVATFASLVKVVDINNTGVSFLQGDKNELIASNLAANFNDDSLAMFKEELIALAEGKTRFETEISVVTPVDGVRALFLCLSVAPGFTDSLSCVIVSFFDITGRKRAEEALQRSNELFQTIIDTIPQAICWKDTDSVFLGCNANFAQMVGLDDTRSIIGKTDRDMPWTDEETEHFLKIDREIMKADTAQYRIVEPAVDASGKEILLATNKSPIHDKTGKVCGIMVACEDITGR